MSKRQAADRKAQKHENRPEGRLCSVLVVVRRVLFSRSRNPQGAARWYLRVDALSGTSA
jgi:hypothetical protein